MYKLSENLINELNQSGIEYCHWKSNVNIKKALGGYDDLDILVKRSDLSKFYIIITKLGFKEAYNSKLNINSIKHFYGFDFNSGEILHLHVYNQILTGPSWTKSYKFDLNKEYFKTRKESSSEMPLPAKSIELIIFIFRIYLKLSSGLEFIPTYRARENIIHEIKYLSNNLNESDLESNLVKYFPNITLNSFLNYMEILLRGNSFIIFIYGLIVRFKLGKFKVYPIFVQIYKSFSQFSYRVFNRFFLKEKKKFNNGGIFIAITGLDASGKSTAISELDVWLSANFTLKKIHFGRPPATLYSFPFSFLFKIFKKFRKKRLSSESKRKNNSSLFYIFRQVILAFDRYSLVIKNFRESSSGKIVLCDRYKSEDYFVMDSKKLIPSSFTNYKKYIARLENFFYDSMPKPDIIINLTVPIDVAIVRNKNRIKIDKESDKDLIKRHKDNLTQNYLANSYYSIDTNIDHKKVIEEIKSIIWKHL